MFQDDTLYKLTYTYLLTSCSYANNSDAKYLSTKVLKYVLKYFLGTYLLVLKYFRKLVLSTYT